MKSPVLAAVILLLASSTAGAAATKPADTKPPDSPSLLPGANSKEPVSIEADKLVYSDKEQKAIYTGDVVLIQGTTKLTCTVMTLFLDKPSPTAGGAAPPAHPTPAASPASGAPSGDNSQVRHMDCAGPVTVLSKTQTATGDSAMYDKPQNKVWLFGHVTLSDGPNVTKGDKLTYDLTTGHATVETSAVGGKTRVQSQFIPGSSSDAAAPAKPQATN